MHYPVDAPTCIVRHVERAVRTLRESHRTMLGLIGLQLRVREVVGEGFVVAVRRGTRHRLEDHAISALWLRRPIPRSVKGDERTVTILVREHRAPVEEQ